MPHVHPLSSFLCAIACIALAMVVAAGFSAGWNPAYAAKATAASSVAKAKAAAKKKSVVKAKVARKAKTAKAGKKGRSVRGNYGRLSIRSLGVNVGLSLASTTAEAKRYTDAKRSAAVIDCSDGNTLIADHCSQGFSAIKRAVPGSTTARIITDSGSRSYTCRAVIRKGRRADYYLAFNNGTPIGAKYTGCVVTYTCNNDGTVFIAIWKSAKKKA